MIEYYHELEEPELLTLQDEEGVESVVELLAQMDVDRQELCGGDPPHGRPGGGAWRGRPS